MTVENATESLEQKSNDHLFNSESGREAQLKSAAVRSENAKKRNKLKEEAREYIKSKSLEELATDLNIQVNLSNELKQEIYAHLLKAMIDVEVVEKAKHRFKTEQMFTKYDLDEMLKEQPTKQDIQLTGEKLTLSDAIKSGLIDESRISLDDVNFLRMFVQ